MRTRGKRERESLYIEVASRALQQMFSYCVSNYAPLAIFSHLFSLLRCCWAFKVTRAREWERVRRGRRQNGIKSERLRKNKCCSRLRNYRPIFSYSALARFFFIFFGAQHDIYVGHVFTGLLCGALETRGKNWSSFSSQLIFFILFLHSKTSDSFAVETIFFCTFASGFASELIKFFICKLTGVLI